MSIIKNVGVGVVTEDTDVDNPDEIWVTPIELVSDNAGDMHEYVHELQGLNKSKIELTNRVTASWKGGSQGNRAYAPTLRAGEVVELYKIEGTEIYMFEELYRQIHLRRLEKVQFILSNINPKDEGLVEDHTSYWIKFDTITKKVHFHTSDNDGEITTYDLSFDTKNGIMELIDKQGNFIKLDSPNGDLTFNINRDVIGTVGRDLTIDVGKNTTINTANDTVINTQNDTTIKTGNNTLIDTGSETVVKSGTSVLVQTPKTTIDSASTKITGTLEVDGNIKGNSSISISDSITSTTVSADAVNGGTVNSADSSCH